MPTHVVSPGDTIVSIAEEYGFLSSTIWDHPQNAALKAKRKSPNILYPGDEVFIPEKELKYESRSTGAKHNFQVKGEPNRLKLQLMRMGKPRANEDYVLNIDGKITMGKTDGSGYIDQVIPRDARSGTLMLKGGKEKFPVRIGHLDPIDQITGVQQRLNNLGFNCGPEDGELNDRTRAALAAFQKKHKLTESGEPDAATKAKLGSLHE
jgi:hypothetical protein